MLQPPSGEFYDHDYDVSKKAAHELVKETKRVRIDQTIGIFFLGANSNRNLIHLKLKTVHDIQERRGAGRSENMGVHK